MQIVHGQAIGFHCFIFVTNDEIEWSSLISIGNEFQITETKHLKEFLLLRIELTRNDEVEIEGRMYERPILISELVYEICNI